MRACIDVNVHVETSRRIVNEHADAFVCSVRA
jgi:hypothetical protein